MTETMKPKRPLNWWMTDDGFLSRAYYRDLRYLKESARTIYNELAELPVPILVTWHSDTKRFKFSIGANRTLKLPITPYIPPQEVVAMVKHWAAPMYPRYDEIDIRESRGLTEKEMADGIASGEFTSYEEAREATIVSNYTESGIITNVQIRNQSTFKLERRIGSEVLKSQRMSKVPLTIFLKELRDKGGMSSADTHDYIMDNSWHVQDLPRSTTVKVRYADPRVVKNFCFIHIDHLRTYVWEIDGDDKRVVRVGKYEISFPNIDSRDECRFVVETYRNGDRRPLFVGDYCLADTPYYDL